MAQKPTQDEVRAAVEKSGFPLQLRVAATLSSEFDILEEWAYEDRITGTLRTVDLRARRPLRPADAAPRVFPTASLLVECKRSDLPYVFFKAVAVPAYSAFPQIHGVPDAVNLFVPRGELSVAQKSVPMAAALGLQEETFVREGPPVCAVFSKVVRRGKTFELSGSEPYHDLMLPLVSALNHSRDISKPGESSGFQEPTLCIAVAVLEAPLIVYDVATHTHVDEPWVRVARHESPRPHRQRTIATMAIDIVHVDFLATYVASHVLPFVRTFHERIVQARRIMEEGVRHLDRMDWSWRDLLDPEDQGV